MADVVSEIREDAWEGLEEEAFCEIENELAEYAAFESHISDIQSIVMTVDEHGLNHGTLTLMHQGGLLSTTSPMVLSTVAMESLSASGNDEAKEQTKKSLVDRLKDKVGEFGAKILSLAKRAKDSFFDKVKDLWESIKSSVQKLKDKMGDKTEGVIASAKARPVASVLMTLTAAVAAIGLVYVINRGMPKFSTNPSILNSFKEKIIALYQKIKWPGGNISVIQDAKAKLSGVKVPKVSATQLGESSRSWSKVALAKVTDLGSSIISKLGSLASVWGDFGVKFVRYSSEFVNSFLGKGAVGAVGGAVTAFFALKGYFLGTLFLISLAIVGTMRIVVGAFRFVKDALSSLFRDDDYDD